MTRAYLLCAETPGRHVEVLKQGHSRGAQKRPQSMAGIAGERGTAHRGRGENPHGGGSSGSPKHLATLQMGSRKGHVHKRQVL